MRTERCWVSSEALRFCSKQPWISPWRCWSALASALRVAAALAFAAGFALGGAVPAGVLVPVTTIVLDRDLPEHGLRRGDLGAVVDLHAPDGLEVEFVLASGKTQALVSLGSADVRALSSLRLAASLL